MVYVYLLKDLQGNVIWVGETKNPEKRLYEHTRRIGNGSSRARFAGRTDLTLEVNSSWPTKKLAYAKQHELQVMYGFITDGQSISAGLKSSPNKSNGGLKSIQSSKHTSKDGRFWAHNFVKHICPHCGHQGGGPSMKRWHFDKCKHRNEE